MTQLKTFLGINKKGVPYIITTPFLSGVVGIVQFEDEFMPSSIFTQRDVERLKQKSGDFYHGY